jgi:predicted kinase
MRSKLLEKLVSEYYLSRPNLQIKNAPLCVFFFACSGSGKSTTRRLLVHELGATYVSNDEVRELLAKYPEAAQQDIELKDIVAETVERIFTEAPNKLVIFDNNIIQYYMHADSYLNVAKARQRPIFIIGLEASEPELENRIKDRGINVAQILSELPGQLINYKKATDDIKPDWVLQSTDDKDALKELFSLLNTVAK